MKQSPFFSRMRIFLVAASLVTTSFVTTSLETKNRFFKNITKTLKQAARETLKAQIPLLQAIEQAKQNKRELFFYNSITTAEELIETIAAETEKNPQAVLPYAEEVSTLHSQLVIGLISIKNNQQLRAAGKDVIEQLNDIKSAITLLEQANLEQANLKQANLEQANLEQANHEKNN